MKKSAAWSLALVAAVVLVPLSVGCGGSPGDDSQIITQVDWSAAKGQCLAGQTPITLDGVSSQAACTELAAHAQQQGLLIPGGGVDTNQAPVCVAVCTCTPSGCDCSQLVCV
jgi:hypothetical protein